MAGQHWSPKATSWWRSFLEYVVPWLALGLGLLLCWFFRPVGLRDSSVRLVTFLGGSAVVIVWVLWWLPTWQVARSMDVTDANRFDRENEARKTIAQIIGGVLLLAGLYSSVKTLDLQRQTQTVQEHTEQLQEQGQINERFTKAIDQLGAVLPGGGLDENGKPKINLEVRLGGIYALEQIAKDAPEKYHWTVMEVLGAYVRENAQSVELRKSLSQANPNAQLKPHADVKAALAVLRRRDKRFDPKHHSIDLPTQTFKGLT